MTDLGEYDARARGLWLLNHPGMTITDEEARYLTEISSLDGEKRSADLKKLQDRGREQA